MTFSSACCLEASFVQKPQGNRKDLANAMSATLLARITWLFSVVNPKNCPPWNLFILMYLALPNVCYLCCMLPLLCVTCCLLLVVCYTFTATCCLLPIVCYPLSATHCLLHVVCYLFSFTCYLLSATCCLLLHHPHVCSLLSAACCLLPLICYPLPVTHCLLQVFCYLLSRICTGQLCRSGTAFASSAWPA